MFNQQEQEFLNNFKIEVELQEMRQAQELIQSCNNKYQFAKTHSEYIKDWEKVKAHMIKKAENGQLSQKMDVVKEMIKIGEELNREKLEVIRFAFEKKFGESIYNYLGKDGKTKKFLGIFG